MTNETNITVLLAARSYARAELALREAIAQGYEQAAAALAAGLASANGTDALFVDTVLVSALQTGVSRQFGREAGEVSTREELALLQDDLEEVGAILRGESAAEIRSPCLLSGRRLPGLGEVTHDVPPTPDPRKLTLFPGNVIRLHQSGVDHLGISVGDTVVTCREEGGMLRMQSTERWCGDD